MCVQVPSQEELEAYGITDGFTEYIRSLNYSTFRDFPSDQVVQAPGTLNAWQVRHSTLVVSNIKEVDELRFVLCPRYMDDDRFWSVYYTLARKHLPEVAFNWSPEDELPYAEAVAAAAQASQEDIFTGLGSQLQQIGKRIHQATKIRTYTCGDWIAL